MPDGQSKLKPKTPPPPPSRRGLPHVIPPADDDSSPAGNLSRLAGYAFRLGEELHAKALDVLSDGDLSDQGKRRKLAKETVGELMKYQRRLVDEGKALARERDRLGEAADRRIRDAAGKLSDVELSEWRQAIRDLSPEARSQVLRDAASGRGPGAEQVMAAATSAASPILLGLGLSDPLYRVTVAQHRERLAEAELAKIAALDQRRPTPSRLCSGSMATS